MRKQASVESTAEAYLELLAARGVEFLFANAGTDFAPIIEAYARRGAHGQARPRPLTVPHEVVAVAMAHGYAMVTGRPQAVMVHVIVGTANALGGIMNAARSNVPMLFTAGRNPITEAGALGSRDRQIHWAQESFDQACIVREFVKWDYELRNFAQLETVVDRALAITQTEPQGPVYLTLPREILGERHEAFEYSDPARAPRPGAPRPRRAVGGGGRAAPRRGPEPHHRHQGARPRSRGGGIAGGAGRGAGRARLRAGTHPRQLPPGPSDARGVRLDARAGRRRPDPRRRGGRALVPASESAAPRGEDHPDRRRSALLPLSGARLPRRRRARRRAAPLAQGAGRGGRAPRRRRGRRRAAPPLGDREPAPARGPRPARPCGVCRLAHGHGVSCPAASPRRWTTRRSSSTSTTSTPTRGCSRGPAAISRRRRRAVSAGGSARRSAPSSPRRARR